VPAGNRLGAVDLLSVRAIWFKRWFTRRLPGSAAALSGDAAPVPAGIAA